MSVLVQGFQALNSLINRVLTTSGDIPVLDPLSVGIRLGLLRYKPRKTKISIGRNHKSIEYDEPESQAIQRLAKGSTRNDIAALDLPIQLSIRLYNFENPYIQYIFQMATEGLRELLCCYDHSHDTVCKAIQLYRGVLLNELNKHTVLSTVPSNATTISQESLKNQSVSTLSGATVSATAAIFKQDIDNTIHAACPHLDLFQTLWTPRYVEMIVLMLQELESQSKLINHRIGTVDLISPALMESICNLVDAKDAVLCHLLNDKQVQDIIKDSNSTSNMSQSPLSPSSSSVKQQFLTIETASSNGNNINNVNNNVNKVQSPPIACGNDHGTVHETSTNHLTNNHSIFQDSPETEF